MKNDPRAFYMEWKPNLDDFISLGLENLVCE